MPEQSEKAARVDDRQNPEFASIRRKKSVNYFAQERTEKKNDTRFVNEANEKRRSIPHPPKRKTSKKT